MKHDELLKHSTCHMCGNLIGMSGLPLFWRVKVERFGLDMNAIRRQDGMAAMMGNAAIARVMGPDEDLAKPMMDPVTVTVCETCCTKDTCVAALPELNP